MAATMHVEVVSAERHVLSADVTALYARTVEGEIGILPGHQPLLAALEIAPVKVVREDGGEVHIAVHRGLLYVGVDKVVVLADIAELATDIDTARALERREALERELQSKEDAVLKASLRKQVVRLQIVDG